MRALLFLAMLCPLLQGCVGVAVLHSRTKVINDPVIPFYSEIPEPVSSQKSSETTNTVVYTAEWLQKNWNGPDHISHGVGNSEEIWTYKSRRIWKGVIPIIVIIPIPLVLPVGRESVCLTLRDGRVVSSSTTKSGTSGGTYGLIPPGPDGRGGGWGVWSLNDDF
jgi:hypothetical protein